MFGNWKTEDPALGNVHIFWLSLRMTSSYFARFLHGIFLENSVCNFSKTQKTKSYRIQDFRTKEHDNSNLWPRWLKSKNILNNNSGFYLVSFISGHDTGTLCHMAVSIGFPCSTTLWERHSHCWWWALAPVVDPELLLWGNLSASG